MAVWTVLASLCLLFAFSASGDVAPQRTGNNRCGGCPVEWTEYNCRCFKFFNNAIPWIEAERICMNYDGNLASVHSNEEYIFLQSLIRWETQGAPETWIGGHDAVEEGVWLWSDGTKMNFQVWSPGEPDNDGDEECMGMNYTNGNMNDYKCYYSKPFVCAIRTLI